MLKSEDIKIESYPKNKSGSMSVHMQSGIMLTHIPSGVSSSCDSERSQLLNRDKAMIKLEANVSAFARELEEDAKQLEIDLEKEANYDKGLDPMSWRTGCFNDE